MSATADRTGSTADRTGSTWKGSIDRTRPSERSRVSWGWIVQAITGVLVLVLVTVHMVANHFIVSRGLRDTADVVAYLTNPFVMVWELVFLIVVTWHGLLGLRAIIFDFGLSDRAQRAVSWLLAIIGFVAVGYGFWLTAVIVSK